MRNQCGRPAITGDADNRETDVKRGIIILGAAMAAACSGQNGNETAEANAAAGDRAIAEPQILAMQPGQWEVTAEMRRMETPNLPGNAFPAIPPTTTSHCITPDLAAKPLDGIMAGGAMPQDCVSESNNVANGRIRATFSCAQGGVPSRTTIDGAFSPTNYEMTMTMRIGEGDSTINSEMLIRGQRTGDCQASAAP